jgi:periplasmic divalent cation tolerance protein
MTDEACCQVVTTTGSRDVADALAQSAVVARVAACAQVSGPIGSVYRWAGAVETAQEWQVTFKTAVDRYAALEEHVRARHSYDVPEIVCTPIVAGNPAYLAWIIAETRADRA